MPEPDRTPARFRPWTVQGRSEHDVDAAEWCGGRLVNDVNAGLSRRLVPSSFMAAYDATTASTYRSAEDATCRSVEIPLGDLFPPTLPPKGADDA